MGQTRDHPEVLLILAAFGRHEDAVDWARQKAVGEFGPVALESEPFEFVETDYYEATMGTGLRITLLAFERSIDPTDLPQIKHQTNRWEDQCAETGRWDQTRPVNVDPGYLTEAKLVLASTKDHHHRIYLRQGIFAEVTLHYSGGRWQGRPWTYPNYLREDYHRFLTRCRDYLRSM